MFQFSDPSKKTLHKFLRMHSPVKTLTNLRVDWSGSVTKSVTKLKAILQTLFEFVFIYF